MGEQLPKRILILGGGFGGVYTAMHLERVLGRNDNVRITLVSQENFFLFTPMLHEVAACDLDMTHIVNPIRKLLKRAHFFEGNVEAIDLPGRRVTVSHGADGHTHDLPYDHLVLALGSVTNFYGLQGLEETALTMKTLGDAIHLRNRVIGALEEAEPECSAGDRQPTLTFVVAGGGFAGVETMAGINDFAREALKFYPDLREDQLRMVLIHPGPVILPELGEELGRYAQTKLAERGVDIRVNTKVTGVSNSCVELSDGTSLSSCNLVWTAGTSANPLLSNLPCALERGRVRTDEFLEVQEWPGVWALGDCASIADPRTGQPYPPTAQHAIRQGKVVAENIAAAIKGGQKKPFVFSTIGLLASIGRRTGVARVFGINFSGFIAWWLWRTVYLSKLPRFEKKVRVAFDWTLDLIFSKDIVQFMTERSAGVSHKEGSSNATSAPATLA
jgi:NADH dehydrogenase